MSTKDFAPAPARSSPKSCEKLTVNDFFGSVGSISTFDSVELQEIDNIEKKGLAENLEVKNTLRYPHISHATNGTSVEHMVIECNAENRKCTVKERHFHCTLCPISKTTMYLSSIKRYILQCQTLVLPLQDTSS